MQGLPPRVRNCIRALADEVGGGPDLVEALAATLRAWQRREDAAAMKQKQAPTVSPP